MEIVHNYRRRSLSEEKKQPHSLEVQRDSFLRECRSRDWEPAAEEYEDVGQHSDAINRPHLRRLLKDIKAGKVKHVYVKHHDRLARGYMLDLILRWLDAFGCKITMGDLPTDVGDTAQAVLGFFMGYDRYFLSLVRRRTAETLADLMEKGTRVGRPLLGFSWNVETKTWTPEPWVVEGMPPQGVSPRAWEKVRERYKAWQEGRLDKILARDRTRVYRSIDKASKRRAEEEKGFEMWLRGELPLEYRQRLEPREGA